MRAMGTRASVSKTIAASGLALFVLSGCAGLGGGASRTGAGASVAVAPAAGTALLEPLQGGLIGRVDLPPISRADRLAALQSEYRALEFTPPGDAVNWRSGDSALSGAVVPSQPYRVGSQDCRQYTHKVTSGAGAPTVMRGTACRNPDGSWTLLS